MRSDVLILALITGACTWGFRYLPLRMDLSDLNRDGPLARFLAATGPAAIASLFVAAVMPYLQHQGVTQGPLVAGVLAVAVVFAATRAAVVATLSGAIVYGGMTALI